jgi:DEAD/DEAH box helicase domain-containing protein
LDTRLTDALPAAANRPRLAHLRHLPARQASTAALPDDLPELLRQRLLLAGVDGLYSHQAEALDLARRGRHLVVATGTASGKSLCYQLPIVERLLTDDKATALYLTPTKALAQDQLRAFRSFRLPHVRAATYDGDTPRGEREAVRRTANVVLTNPDMLHVGILPQHRRWGDFLHSRSWWSTSATWPAACSARTWPRYCDGYGGSATATRQEQTRRADIRV